MQYYILTAFHKLRKNCPKFWKKKYRNWFSREMANITNIFFFSRPNAKHELRSNIIDIPPPPQKKKHKKLLLNYRGIYEYVNIVTCFTGIWLIKSYPSDWLIYKKLEKKCYIRLHVSYEENATFLFLYWTYNSLW